MKHNHSALKRRKKQTNLISTVYLYLVSSIYRYDYLQVNCNHVDLFRFFLKTSLLNTISSAGWAFLLRAAAVTLTPFWSDTSLKLSSGHTISQIFLFSL